MRLVCLPFGLFVSLAGSGGFSRKRHRKRSACISVYGCICLNAYTNADVNVAHVVRGMYRPAALSPHAIVVGFFGGGSSTRRLGMRISTCVYAAMPSFCAGARIAHIRTHTNGISVNCRRNWYNAKIDYHLRLVNGGALRFRAQLANKSPVSIAN